MVTNRTLVLLVLFVACGIGIGILGAISSFYAAAAFLLFPNFVGLLFWSVVYDISHASSSTVELAPKPSQQAEMKVDPRAHERKAA